MSLAASILLAGTPAAAVVAPDPEVAQEIVVIGRKIDKRLSRWRGRLRKVDGEVVCETRRSTRDAAIDAIGCNAMLACFAPVIPEMDRIGASETLSRNEKDEQADALARSTGPCVYETRQRGIDRLARERAGA